MKNLLNFNYLLMILFILSIPTIGFVSSCGPEYRYQQEQNHEKVIRDKHLIIIMKYHEYFDNYLLMKYDGYSRFYSHAIEQPTDWIKVKIEAPELFELYIKPVKEMWDSLKLIPYEIAKYDGTSEDYLKYKIRMKELEKIKVKKSENVNILTGNNIIYVDSLKNN